MSGAMAPLVSGTRPGLVAAPAPNRLVRVGEILPRAETPYAAVADAVAESDVIAVVHGPERGATVLGPSPLPPAADTAAAAAVVAVPEVTVGDDTEADEQPDFPPPPEEEDET